MPPRYQWVAGPSAFDAFELRVRALLAGFPTMPAKVIVVGRSAQPTGGRRSVVRRRPQLTKQ